MNEMRQAIEEYRIAENLFNNARTNDEIDRAIYLVAAAEIRVNSIIKNAKGEFNGVA